METYSRNVEPPPQAVVQDGQCNMGTFSGPIECVNPLKARNPLGVPVPEPLLYFRLREWQALQISNDAWFICPCIYNTKSVAVVILLAYDKRNGSFYRYERKVPFWRIRNSKGVWNSRCHYHGRNFSIDIRNNVKAGTIHVEYSAKKFPGLPDCSGKFISYHETDPMVIVQPFGKNRPLYSHKALMPCEGWHQASGSSHVFSRPESCMIVDELKGYYPFSMQYDWVTGLGYDENRILMGFNLTDNQVQDPHRYNENCLWHDGRMIPLPPVKFVRPSGNKKAWIIQDEQGLLDLRFTPLKDVDVYVNLGIFACRYHAPIGAFKGYIKPPGGDNRVCFDGFVGMGEKVFMRV